MKRLTILYCSIVVLMLGAACSSAQSDLKTKIEDKEKTLTAESGQLQPGELLGTKGQKELIDLLYSYYTAYPEDKEYSALCLDKVHMVYSAIGDYQHCAMYGDTLLEKYPDYINRAMILESQANTYDFFITPRDTAKVRYYNELLLEENPDLPKEKREAIKDRLDNLHLSLEELILKNN